MIAAPVAAPVAERDRLVSMDVLRGFVLLGIFVMNIQSFSMPMSAYINPTSYGDLTGANWWVWTISHIFFDQKFMTIFSLLFGAGVMLMTERAGVDAWRLHRRRMGWLVLFGLLHAHLFWYGDILYTYGMCGLLAFLFRYAAPRALILFGSIFIVVGLLLPIGVGQVMPAAEFTKLRDEVWQPAPENTARELSAYRGGVLDQAAHRSPESLQFELFYFILFAFWKVFGLMLIGMALLKLDVFTARRPARFYLKFAAVNLAIGLPLALYGLMQNFAHRWAIEYSMFVGAGWNYMGSTFVSLGYTGLFMAIVSAGVMRALTARLAAVGRMAFSNYILQTVIATTIFYGHGFGMFGSVERTGQAAIVIAVWIFQLLVSPIWLRHFLFGPLEWVWRSLTYGQRQPLLRLKTKDSRLKTED